MSGDRRYDLVDIAQRPECEGDAPRYLLLIGDNVGGNAFGLDLREATRGQIYYWEQGHSLPEDGLRLVAKCFASFVEGLQSEF